MHSTTLRYTVLCLAGTLAAASTSQTALDAARPAAPAEGATLGAPPVCRVARLERNSDYSFLVGSAEIVPSTEPESGSTYRWLTPTGAGEPKAVGELLRLAFDGSTTGSGGEQPTSLEKSAFGEGKWGEALRLAPGATLEYSRTGNIDLDEGTIEMWVALRLDGGDPVYAARNHLLLHYRAPNGDTIAIAQAKDTGVLYAGGSVGGEWQSAYSLSTSMRGWQAGEWHHVAYTFSAADGSMRFYLDGALAADTNERRYDAPSDEAAVFSVGGDVWGNTAEYLIDELRITARPLDGAEVSGRARRRTTPGAFEVWRSTADLSPGAEVAYEFTPMSGEEAGPPCVSSFTEFPGIPIFAPVPPSTLLAAETEDLELQVSTSTETACRYSVGEALDIGAMIPFSEGAGGRTHRTTVPKIDSDPNIVTDVYVRSEAHPDFLLGLRYRCLSQANPDFPRTGNLWGYREFQRKGMEYASRIDLWLGAAFTPAEIRNLRELNDDVRVLTSVNAIEARGLPDDYYLKDVTGGRIEVWPDSYRLNLTKLYVAEQQAHTAYEKVLASDLQFDGCFFDNFMTTQSWLRRDIYGREVQIDADEDGEPDDPDELDRAWKAGLFHELETFRELMPDAIMSAHSTNIYEPGIAETFNGTSIGFWTTDVIEGKRRFSDLMERYAAWNTMAREPRATMIESSPPDQISYGYDYSPREKIPASTLEFARTYYPYVRFGLAFTLLDDGYFAHEFGDTWHGNDWWYDELDYELGLPLGPAERVEVGQGPGPNIIENGTFERPSGEPSGDGWSLWANSSEGCEAAASLDRQDPGEGIASARLDITATSGVDWHVGFAQYDRELEGGAVYRMEFSAKALRPRQIGVSAQKGSPDWRNYGLGSELAIDESWRRYGVTFEATESTDESRIQFFVGKQTGTVWLDDVRVYEIGPDVYKREFDNGLVVLNASREAQTIDVGAGFRRLTGSQAPRLETIVDDEGAAFSCTGDCEEASYESGEWGAAGPFFHDWGAGCRELGPGGQAVWMLPIDASDSYTVTAWWPAAPEAAGWSQAMFEVISDGAVACSTTLDQQTGGDEWHPVCSVRLAPDKDAQVRMRCASSGSCVADALHLRSAARYNDGSRVVDLRLQPMDGIVLSRTGPDRTRAYLPLVETSRVIAASCPDSSARGTDVASAAATEIR